MRKFIYILIMSLVFLYGCANESEKSNIQTTAPALQDDFYTAVNYDVLSSWVIPADKSSISYFQNITDTTYDRLNALIQQTLTANAAKGTDEYSIKAIYETASDWEKRNISGYGELQQYLDRIDAAADLKELLKISMELDRKYGIESIYNFYINNDLEDSTRYVYYLYSQTGISKEHWISANTLYSQAYIDFMKNLWILNGTDYQEADNIVNEVANMMKEIAKVSLSVNDMNNPALINNRKLVSDMPSLLNNAVTADDFISIYGCTAADTVIVIDTGAFSKIAEYLTNANLNVIRNYIKTLIYDEMATNVDIETFKAYYVYNAQITGLTEIPSVERNLNETVQKVVEYELGRIYSLTYFDNETKQDITNMITDIKNIYMQRIDNLSWMGAETKVQAKNKLEKLKAVVGYDENGVWPQDIYKYGYTGKDENGIYINNILAKSAALQNYLFSNKNNPVNKNILSLAPQTVNAAYSPLSNTITIFAGILQSPIYSINADAEANAGGIGVIIAHEITHAFDNTGSMFDAEGNYGNSWWSESDRQKFNELTQKVITYYDSYEINGYPINGTLTLSENIADLGAVSCITEYALNKGYDLSKVYISYAKMWATKNTEESEISSILNNVHAPAKIRVNAVLSAMDKFYEVFNVNSSNGMYKAAEERPSIW